MVRQYVHNAYFPERRAGGEWGTGGGDVVL